MKNGVREIVGKTIKGVVVATGNSANPNEQVFLLFDDGSYYEFYGNQFSCAGGVDRGSEKDVVRYAKQFGGTIRRYPDAP